MVSEKLKKLGITEKCLSRIKEKAKRIMYNDSGFYPLNSEGCCLIASRLLRKELRKGEIKGGFFIVDRKVKEKEIQIQTIWGIRNLCLFGDNFKELTHWWLEIAGFIIDLTAEQFNKFLEEPFEKIVVIHKNSRKAKRYKPYWYDKEKKMLKLDKSRKSRSKTPIPTLKRKSEVHVNGV